MKPEKTSLTLGFVPLTDSAPLVVAKELGLFERHGLEVTLQKQNSWATLRDKLHAGVLDAAQMLAPMPIASTLGLGCEAHHIVTPLILSLNGNAITLSQSLHREILEANHISALSLPLSASMLNAVIEQRHKSGADKLVFATVFPYSCHFYQLRDWLRSAGIGQDEVDIIIVPPLNMVSALKQNDIDGFCVGGPWNAKAVRAQIGTTVVTSFDIWLDSPEKVLGMQAAFVRSKPQTTMALCAALKQACDWLATVPNRFEAATMLSKFDYLNESLDVIAPSLIGSCLTHHTRAPRSIPSYNQFANTQKGSINQPQPIRGEWLLEQMIRAGQIPVNVDSSQVISKVFRSDIYQNMAHEIDLLEQRPMQNGFN